MTEERQKITWMQKLQNRWGVSAGRVIIILIVFALTGFSVMFLKHPILNLITGGGEQKLWMTILYYIFILPVYNVLLLFYGSIFGQFRFFWDFEKRFFNRMFNRKKKVDA